jgi:hypothetical protein
MRASDLLGRVAYDAEGNQLGWIADLVVMGAPDDLPNITDVIITRRRTRLFGYEREEISGPWIIERLATWLQGPAIQLPYSQLHLTKR